MPIVGPRTPISDDQIAQAIVKAGITNSKRVPQGQAASGIRVVADFVAIALAESRGIPGNYNTIGAGHYGLWQISALHFPGRDASKVAWTNPDTNAKYAVQVFEEQGYGAWTTYTGGQYRFFLTRGRIAAEKALNAKYPDVIEDPLGDAKEALEAAKKFGAFISDRQNWIRVGLFFAGLLIITIAVIRSTAPTAIKAVKTVRKFT